MIDLVRYFLAHPKVKRAWIASVVAIVVTLGVWLAYWLPLQNNISVLQQEITLKRRALVNTVEQQKMVNAYRRVSKQVGVLKGKLRYRGSQSDLVRNLTRLAKKHRVTIVSESFDEGKTKHGYSSLILDLNLRGSYPAIRAFIRDIPSLPSWSVIQSARLEASRKNRQRIKTTLRLVTYRFLGSNR